MDIYVTQRKDEIMYEIIGTKSENKVACHSEDMDKGRELKLNSIVSK
jgi:hypothetical protein